MHYHYHQTSAAAQDQNEFSIDETFKKEAWEEDMEHMIPGKGPEDKTYLAVEKVYGIMARRIPPEGIDEKLYRCEHYGECTMPSDSCYELSNPEGRKDMTCPVMHKSVSLVESDEEEVTDATEDA